MTGLDMTESIAPKSDQLNADDLMTGPRVFTIAEVKHGNAEQPFDFHLVEFPGRPFRPSKSMRRVMVMAWGKDASTYAGKRLKLYRDPEIMFGRDKVGGIRIEAMSHIDKPLTVALTVTRGKRAPYVVQPLKDEAPAPARPKPNAAALIENAQEARHNADLDAVARAAAGLTGEELDAVKAAVLARRAQLKAEPTTDTIPGTETDQ